MTDLMGDYVEDLFMLALVTWREARAEPYVGKLAVAYSIMNRVDRPSWWGDSVPTVVWKKWQYSSMTDPKDPQLAKLPRPDMPEEYRAWKDCLKAAISAFNRDASNPAPGADSYYAISMKTPPNWADEKKFVAQIGGHRFYDLDADYERKAA